MSFTAFWYRRFLMRNSLIEVYVNMTSLFSLAAFKIFCPCLSTIWLQYVFLWVSLVYCNWITWGFWFCRFISFNQFCKFWAVIYTNNVYAFFTCLFLGLSQCVCWSAQGCTTGSLDPGYFLYSVLFLLLTFSNVNFPIFNLVESFFLIAPICYWTTQINILI